jgi:hypothetical protein
MLGWPPARAVNHGKSPTAAIRDPLSSLEETMQYFRFVRPACACGIGFAAVAGIERK